MFDIQVAVTSMQDARDVVELTILRDSRETPPSHIASSGYNVSFDFRNLNFAFSILKVFLLCYSF